MGSTADFEKDILNRKKLLKMLEPCIEIFVWATGILKLRDFTLHTESDCQTVDAAAVSSLTLMLSSRVPYFDANTNIAEEPVVGSNVCETVTFVVTFPQPVFCTAMSDKRPRRADETDICDAHPEFAGSLICTEESKIHEDDDEAVDLKEVRGEKSAVP